MRNNDQYENYLSLCGVAIGAHAVISGNLLLTNLLMLTVVACKALPKWSEGPVVMAHTAVGSMLKLGKGVIFGAMIGAAWNRSQNPTSDAKNNTSPSFI
jgi:hypothetical protein